MACLIACLRASLNTLANGCALLPLIFRGSDRLPSRSSSNFHGALCSSQQTKALSAIQSPNHRSPLWVRVIRLPLPTLLKGNPLRSVNKTPSERRSVDPSALPLKWVVILLLKFCLLFGLPILSGEMPTYKRVKESLVTHPSTETLPGMSLKNQA